MRAVIIVDSLGNRCVSPHANPQGTIENVPDGRIVAETELEVQGVWQYFEAFREIPIKIEG